MADTFDDWLQYSSSQPEVGGNIGEIVTHCHCVLLPSHNIDINFTDSTSTERSRLPLQ